MPGKLSKIPSDETCYVKNICTKCDFYGGSSDNLECAAYKILKELVKKNIVKLTDISDAKIDSSSQK